MIFKTFDSDIDNMSSRWGMFGKSFSDIGDTITTKWKQVTDYVAVTNDATISGMMSAWKGTSPVQFLSDDSVVNVLNDYNKALDKGAEATAKFFEAGTGNDFMNGWLKQLKGAPATMDDYKAAVAKTELAQNGLTASMVASKVAALALNVAVSMGVSIAISALIKLVDNLVHANEKAIEKAEELRDKYNDFKETNASNVKTLNDLKDEFEELSDGVSQHGDNISLTTEQYARYKEIVQQIVNMSPSLAEGYDTENGYIADKNKLLERAIELQEIEYRNELRKRTNLTGDLKTSMEGHIAEYKKSLDDGKSNTSFSNALWKVFNTNNRDNYDGQSMARDIMESLGVKDIDKEIEKYINEYGYWQNDKFWNDYCDQIANNLDAVTNSLSAEEVGLDDTVFDQNIEKLESYAEKYNDVKDSVKSANESIQIDLGYIAEYVDGYSELSSEQQKFVTNYLKGFDISDITSTDAFGNLVYDEDKMASVKSQIKDFVNSLSKDDSIKQTLTDLYAPQSDSETIDEYKQRIDSALKIIRQYCEDNKIEIPVGLSDIENNSTNLADSYDQTIKNAEEQYNVTISEDNLSAVEYYNEATESAEKYRSSLDDIYKSYNGINNVDRDIIYWDDENLEKYKSFIDSWGESAEDLKGTWSTVLGSSENIDGVEVAFTAMLQTDHGLVPLEQDTFWQYFDSIFNQSWNEDGTFDAEKFIQLDKEGTDMVINGQMEHVANMIAAAEGQYMNGVKLTADDVIAIGSPGYDENGKDLIPDNNSKYKGKSMHEVQEWALENRYALAQLDEQAKKTGTSVNNLIAEAEKYDDNTDWESWFAENVHTQEDIDRWREIQQSCNDATEAKKKYLETDTSNETPIYSADFKALNDSLSKLTDNAELLSKVNKEISESGRISAENLKKINEAFPEDKYPEMTKALYQYENGLINSTQLFEKLEEAYNTDSENYAENVKSKAETDNNYYSILKELYPSLFENLQSLYQGDFDNWKNLAEAKKGVELKLISEIGSAWKAYYNVFQTEDGSYDYASTGVTVDRGADTGDEDEARELENAAMDKYKADAKKFVDGMNEALAEINKLSPDITAPSWQELSPDTSKSSSKDSTDAWKEEAEKQIKLLDHYHNMGYLSDEQYYKALNELNEKYYAGQEKYLDDYRSYAEKIYSGLKQAYSDMLNKQKDYMGQAINAVTGYLDDQIDALNDQKDAVEDEYNARIEALESEQDLLDEQKDAIEEQKNAIQEQIDAIDKANEARQKAIDLQKKQYELNRAMNQNTNKVYVNGQMVWQTDDSAITDARNDLEDAKAQDATDKLQDQIDELDKASDALDKQKDALQAQIDSLNDELDKITEGIEKQIDELQKYRDRWAEIPDQFTYVQNQMIASMMLGQDWQQKALSMNEDMLYTFGTSYNNIQGQLQLVTDASAQDIVNMAQLSGEQLGILAAQADESLTEMGGSIQGQSEISEEALNQLMLAGTDSLSTLASKVGESSQSVCTSIGDIISKASDAITTLNQLSELQDKMDFAPIYSGVTVTAMRNGGVVEVETARKGTVTGSHRSKIAKSLGEDHLVVAREGEGFVPPEQVKDVQDSVKAVNKFADLLIPAEPKFKFDNFDVGQTVMSSNLIKQPGLDFNGVSNTTSQNNTIKIESGAIVLNEVTKPDVVGEAIIKELPNYVTRKLNQR